KMGAYGPSIRCIRLHCCSLLTGRDHAHGVFDIPQLRGIGRTAPYFHNNKTAIREDIGDVVPVRGLASCRSVKPLDEHIGGRPRLLSLGCVRHFCRAFFSLPGGDPGFPVK
ncbi:MAG: hypothetical protein ACREXP_16090, partial [Steroidobacteraceae bacterium]